MAVDAPFDPFDSAGIGGLGAQGHGLIGRNLVGNADRDGGWGAIQPHRNALFERTTAALHYQPNRIFAIGLIGFPQGQQAILHPAKAFQNRLPRRWIRARTPRKRVVARRTAANSHRRANRRTIAGRGQGNRCIASRGVVGDWTWFGRRRGQSALSRPIARFRWIHRERAFFARLSRQGHTIAARPNPHSFVNIVGLLRFAAFNKVFVACIWTRRRG